MAAGPETSPGGTTADGCSVELYDRMPALGEAELLHDRLASGAGVLDLGCGTGRIARPLADLGHWVVAVDESTAMLARLPATPRIRPRHGTIEDLRLEDRFEAVLLASNMVNTRDEQLRQSMLVTCRHHLKPGGRVFVQWCRPEWFQPGSRAGALGDIAVAQQVEEVGPALFRVVADYELNGDAWRHDYVARQLTVADLEGALALAGLTLSEWITEDQSWFTATAS